MVLYEYCPTAIEGDKIRTAVYLQPKKNAKPYLPEEVLSRLSETFYGDIRFPGKPNAVVITIYKKGRLERIWNGEEVTAQVIEAKKYEKKPYEVIVYTVKKTEGKPDREGFLITEDFELSKLSPSCLSYDTMPIREALEKGILKDVKFVSPMKDNEFPKLLVTPGSLNIKEKVHEVALHPESPSEADLENLPEHVARDIKEWRSRYLKKARNRAKNAVEHHFDEFLNSTKSLRKVFTSDVAIYGTDEEKRIFAKRIAIELFRRHPESEWEMVSENAYRCTKNCALPRYFSGIASSEKPVWRLLDAINYFDAEPYSVVSKELNDISAKIFDVVYYNVMRYL